jgi:nucleoside-diphosphate-sugar epimerase
MLKNRNLLITGGTGFVGNCILDYLSSLETEIQPKKIYLVSRNASSAKVPTNLNVCSLNKDLEKKWEFGELPRNLDIIHLAADGSESSYSTNASASALAVTQNLSDWMMSNDFRSVFFASSGACAGYKPLPNTGMDPRKNAFVEGRLKAESIFLAAARGLGTQFTIGRLYTFIGKRILEKRQYAVSDFMHKAVEEKSIVIKGNPMTVRSYLSEFDMANWILKSVEMDHPLQRIEVGSDNPVTILELAQRICELSGSKLQINQSPTFGDIYLPLTQQTRASLKVNVTQTWENLIEDSLRYLKGAIK